MTAIVEYGEVMPAFVPFQLSDEMYAKVIRDPEAHGYPRLPAGSVKAPKFGYCFVECHQQQTGLRPRPKRVDGLDWVPSSTANASGRVLSDGKTELLRCYYARRTKSDAAKPLVKPYVAEAEQTNRKARQRLAQADPSELLVRHEMWLQEPEGEAGGATGGEAEDDEGSDEGSTRVLVHYLGDDAFQQMTVRPRPHPA
jgi:hypothetical protein